MRIKLREKFCLMCLFFFTILFTNCKKKSEELHRISSLAFVESAIPTVGLPAVGGSITLEVNWAYTRWNLKVEEQMEEAIEITEITPAYAGSVDFSASKTKVKITFKSNNTYISKSRTLTIRSTTGDLKASLKIYQLGKSADPINILLNTATTYQKISGFGGGNTMWGTDFLNASELKSLFGLGENELGLSIFRVRLSPNKLDWPLLVNTLKEAKKYGVIILASPWTPPALWKNNKNLVGGYLLEEHYQDYANYINDFVKYMLDQGVIIDVVSIQNEPDISVSYEGCHWSAEQIYKFVKEYGGGIIGTKVMAAESFNFKQSYTDKIMNDPLASENLDIVGGHIYGGGLSRYPLAEQMGKEVWMTEYLMNQNSGSNPANWNPSDAAIWDETLDMIETVHDAVLCNWNAYIWWYARRFYSFLGDGEYGTTRGAVLKRGYAMSQYGKFIRPGYMRIALQMENTTATKLKITAYKGDNKIIVVIINPENYNIKDVNFSLLQTINSARSYTTSVQQNWVKEDLLPNDKKVSIEMGAKSIKTLILE